MRALVSRRAERAFVNAWRRQGAQKAAADFWSRETASCRAREEEEDEEEENLSLDGGKSKWLTLQWEDVGNSGEGDVSRRDVKEDQG